MTTEYGVTRVCLGWPWYAGPDQHTYQRYMEMVHYFGKLQERSEWLAWAHAEGITREGMPSLDKGGNDGGADCDIMVEDGIFEFGYSDEGGLSLPGLARENVADNALRDDYDYLLFWDDDMLFSWATFLKLWRHQKPIVAALAFAAREPTYPVIFRINQMRVGGEVIHKSQYVLDYPKDQLISDEDIGAAIAFGAGVVLIHMDVFRQIPKPWFYSTGCGEDWMFCVRAYLNGVPRYVDTATKTYHKEWAPRWIGEEQYEQRRKDHPDVYAKLEEAGRG